MSGCREWIMHSVGRSGRHLLEVYYLARYLFFIPGTARLCPCCGSHFRRFLPAVIGSRGMIASIRCPRCDSHPRHRLLWLFLQEHCRQLFAEPLRLLHIAPEFCFLRCFRAMANLRYVSGDLTSPLADSHFDLTCLPFAGGTFDVVFCNHVLEHVRDDGRAISEIYRVLKPGGWGILQVPVEPDLLVTLEDWSITTPEERARHFGQNDHVRRYGSDYPEKLRAAGFTVNVIDFTKRFEPARRNYFGLDPTEAIYHCAKPDGVGSPGGS